MDLADLSARLQEDLDSSTDLLRRYVENHRGRLFLNVLLFVGLIFMTLAGRRRARDLAAAGDGALRAATASLFDRPYSAAALAGLVSTLLMNPGRPRVAADLIGVLMLPPLLRIVRPLVTAAVAPAVYGLAVLVLLDRARAELTVSPAFDQVVLLVEMLAAIGGLAWLLASGRLDRAAAGETASEGVRGRHVAAGICLVLCLVAFSATAWGTLRLARTVGSSVLVGAILAMAFHATIHVADSLLAFAFRVRPLRLLAMVRNHRDLLERRAHRWLGWIAIGGWTAIMVRYAGLQDPVLAFGAAVLSAELRRGAIGISLGDVLAFLLTVWLAFMASAFLRFLLEEDVFPHLRLARGVPYVISSLLHYVILFLGFLLAIAALGLDLNKVTILAGAFGVGLGFGLQGMVNNFVSGLIVLLERPISVGDTIQLGDVSGEVRRIGIRSTTVQTPEGAEVIVPNGSLVAEKVTNWTLSSHVRRLNVVAGVAYGTPPGEVLELLRAVAAAHPQVLAHPAPTALFLGFGESAMNFALYAWTAHFDRWAEIRSDLNVAVYAALQKAGIEIPFPQHEVHLRQK
jgi:small-conductance mechanosensitive channel